MDDKLIFYLKKYGDIHKLEENIQRLKNGESVQYIVGTMDFYGYEFIVNHNVLIPRFETEELVERTIKYCKKYDIAQPKILDLGTGSGCIAITLALEIPHAKVTAVDVSADALLVAKENAKKHHVNIELIESDMLDKVEGKYDIIISNPPYIDVAEEIDEVVRNNEPHLALFAKNHGLYYYEVILKEARSYLKEKSMIAFEIGQSQGKEVVQIAKQYFSDADIILEKDLQKRDRFVFVINTK